MSTALAVLDPTTPAPALLRPIASPAEVLAAQNETRDIIAKTLKEGHDYGVIPGTNKPTLLKPGAEHVTLAFGCYFGDPEILEREVDHDRVVQWRKRNGRTGESVGLYRYVVRVPVINRATGERVGFGIGACSSMEPKYVEEPRAAENTIVKMAHKRALVSAALVTFGLSDQFTQDVEDLVPEGEQRANPPVAPRAATSPAASSGTTTAPSSGSPPNGEVKCPRCSGPMWDNRESKTNPRAPDYKCRDRSCDGAIWPPKNGKIATPKAAPLSKAVRGAPANPPREPEEIFDEIDNATDEIPF